MGRRLTVRRAGAAGFVMVSIGALVLAMSDPMLWLEVLGWAAVAGTFMVLAAAPWVPIPRGSGDEQARAPKPGVMLFLGFSCLVNAVVALTTGLALWAVVGLLAAAACFVLAVRASLSR